MKPLSLLLAVVFAWEAFASQEDYPLTVDSLPQPDVPKGEFLEFEFTGSQIFPGTTRNYWLYVPSQYDPETPACLLLTQGKSPYKASTVLDNLIHKGELPVIIGVFVHYGRILDDETGRLIRYNRSFEWDSLGDRYARFLLEELLPEVERKTTSDGRPIRLTRDPNSRMIAGGSTGGIAAFTVAWERPDSFRKVFSNIGTFVDLMGGARYPTLIRKTEPKPLRVFLQSAENDNNSSGGNWLLANKSMTSALEYAGYDVDYAWGTGGHDFFQASQIFPDVMRWMWRDWPEPLKPDPLGQSRSPVAQMIRGHEGWQLVSEGHRFTEGPAVNEKGEVFFTDIPNSRIHKIALDGSVTLFASDTGKANGMQFGPDGRLYACSNGNRQIVAYDEEANKTVIAGGFGSNDIAITHSGLIYVTEPREKRVWLVRPGGEKQIVDEGISFPNGVNLSPDQRLLYVADMHGQTVYSFLIQENGTLAHKQKLFHLQLKDGSGRTNADGMVVDVKGQTFVTTEMGVQIVDSAGRVRGILSKPQSSWLANAVFGGSNFDELYVTARDKVFKRKLNTQGALPFLTPITPKPSM